MHQSPTDLKLKTKIYYFLKGVLTTSKNYEKIYEKLIKYILLLYYLSVLVKRIIIFIETAVTESKKLYIF